LRHAHVGFGEGRGVCCVEGGVQAESVHCFGGEDRGARVGGAGADQTLAAV
jgi:hypothetical protein